MTSGTIYQISSQDLQELAERIIEQYNSTHPQEARQEPQQPEQQQPRFYTRQQVCEMLQISKPTLHNLLNSGVLRYTKLGGKTLIFADHADAQISTGQLAKYRNRRSTRHE